MFTGIIKAKGQIESDLSKESQLVIRSHIFQELKPKLGASIAIDGVCLSISKLFHEDPSLVSFDLGLETLSLTNFKSKPKNTWVNIEPALRVGEPLDGHIVQGHIDSLGEIINITNTKNNILLDISFPENLKNLIIHKSSISINGVSLTINQVSNLTFSVCLIPHTIKFTCFDTYQVGDRVHIETDIMGRYLVNLFHKDTI